MKRIFLIFCTLFAVCLYHIASRQDFFHFDQLYYFSLGGKILLPENFKEVWNFYHSADHSQDFLSPLVNEFWSKTFPFRDSFSTNYMIPNVSVALTLFFTRLANVEHFWQVVYGTLFFSSLLMFIFLLVLPLHLARHSQKHFFAIIIAYISAICLERFVSIPDTFLFSGNIFEILQNTFRYLSHPPSEYSFIGNSPRSVCTLGLFSVFYLRWNKRYGASYLMLAFLSLIHSLYAGIFAAVLLVLDMDVHRGRLKFPQNLLAFLPLSITAFVLLKGKFFSTFFGSFENEMMIGILILVFGVMNLVNIPKFANWHDRFRKRWSLFFPEDPMRSDLMHLSLLSLLILAFAYTGYYLYLSGSVENALPFAHTYIWRDFGTRFVPLLRPLLFYALALFLVEKVKAPEKLFIPVSAFLILVGILFIPRAKGTLQQEEMQFANLESIYNLARTDCSVKIDASHAFYSMIKSASSANMEFMKRQCTPKL